MKKLRWRLILKITLDTLHPCNDKRKLNAVSYEVLLKEEPQYETPIHNQPAACKVDDLLPDSGYTELQRTNEDEIKWDYQKLIHRGEGHLVSSDWRKELYDDIKSTVNIPTWVQQGRLASDRHHWKNRFILYAYFYVTSMLKSINRTDMDISCELVESC